MLITLQCRRCGRTLTLYEPAGYAVIPLCGCGCASWLLVDTGTGTTSAIVRGNVRGSTPNGKTPGPTEAGTGRHD